ncbi:MAG: helix-turn-helix domain-containing protein [Lautropia sp.]|nr:helix-turn-helix domain-containing protein [Lautropia sp.]
MRRQFKTADVAVRHELDYWQEAVCSTYFPLSIESESDGPIKGALDAWEFEGRQMSISSLASAPACYSRSQQHIGSDEAPCYLITVPCLSGIHFEQDGKRIRCEPGTFIVERSDLPYRFGYTDFNQVMVLKVPEVVLHERVGRRFRPAGLAFDSQQGLGRVFLAQLRAVYNELPQLNEAAQTMLLDQLIDHLGLIIQHDDRVLHSEAPGMAAFHLANIERFILTHLSDGNLTPERIATGCGMSVRYLYKLLGAQDTSPNRLVYEKRLLAVYRQLADPRVRQPIAELAYAHGFNDPAHFSRAFRARFGASPSEVRRRGH